MNLLSAARWTIKTLPLSGIYYLLRNFEITMNSLWNNYEITMKSLEIHFIVLPFFYEFTIFFEFSLFFANSLWTHYLIPEITMNVLFSAKSIWIQSLVSRNNLLNSQSASRIHYEFTSPLRFFYKFIILFAYSLWIHYFFAKPLWSL